MTALLLLLGFAIGLVMAFVSRGAKERNDLSVPATRVLNGEERRTYLRSVPALSADDNGVDRWPVTLSGKAAKGFDRERARDRVVGVDQVSAQERQRWTGGDVKPWGIN